MTARFAFCGCGQLRAECLGEPIRVSVCHCLDCQRRSGSAFAAQARWPEEQVRISGRHKEWRRAGDGGGTARFLFCPECGSTVAYTTDSFPGVVAVPVGGFADPAFPAPASQAMKSESTRGSRSSGATSSISIRASEVPLGAAIGSSNPLVAEIPDFVP